MSRVFALLAGLALTAGVVLVFLNATVFDADGFAARVDASLRDDAVSAQVARRVTDQVLVARPDLVAVRPLIEGATQSIVRGAVFRSIVRGAARDVHRSAFDRHASTVTLTLADVGQLVAKALEQLRPEVANRIPAGLQVRLATASGGFEGAALEAAELAERTRIAAWIALLLAAALGAAAIWTGRRAGIFWLGIAGFVWGGLAAVACALGPRLFEGVVRAMLHSWLDPLGVWCLAVCAIGAITALAAASVLRPVGIVPWLVEQAQTRRTARPFALIALGLGLILWPRAVLALAGGVLVLAGAGELLGRVPQHERNVPRLKPLAATAGALAAVVAVAAALATDGGATIALTGRCNGSADLCDRTLDRVAFVGTHNSMAAEGEPGWLFAAQDAGIGPQLDDGVRALLIDTHYGFATPRGVATDLSGETKSRAKVVDEVGEQFVATAERLRERIGFHADSERSIFLCHAFCEVGATPALEALTQVHRWLVNHPEEVLILSIEDDTEAADTAKLIRDSGLIREVYRGDANTPWPTLKALIERDERVLVLIENDPGTEPWMHKQSDVAQETPFHFGTAAALEADQCEPNRGGTKGSLLLVNHWVDTSPAPRPTIAREVNQAAVLQTRLARCRTRNRPFPTILAIDFYRQGDAFKVAGQVTQTG